jgi:peptidyl-prolyl cis-trans isomerase D
MLKIFRKKGVAKKVLWAIAGVIIISFGFGFGISRYSDSFDITQTAGKVFGKKISLKDFRRYSQGTLDQVVMQHGADNQKILASMDIDNETWTRIILLKAAEEQGIKVADMEVIRYIQELPFFQRDGQFDKMLYKSIVGNVFNKNSFSREPRDFEESLRDQLKIMKLFQPAIKAIDLSDEAVRKEYEKRNQKAQVDYALISPDNYTKDVSADAAELAAYFKAHPDEFRQPEEVNATVLTVPVDAKATKEDKDKASAKADALLEKLQSGADLAAAATEFGAEVKETGLFSMNMPNPAISWTFELLQKLPASKVGDIMPVDEVPPGFQIVVVKEKKEAFIPEFDKVKDKVQTAVLKEKATKLATEKAAEIQKVLAEKVKSGVTFAAATKELKLDVKQTPLFTLGSYVPEVGMSEDFTKAAFTLNKDNSISAPVITPRGPAILSFVTIEAIDEKKFAADKKEFTDSLSQEKRMGVMNEMITSLKDKAKLENYLEDITSKQKNAVKKMQGKK